MSAHMLTLLQAADGTLDTSADNVWSWLIALTTGLLGVLGTLAAVYVTRQRRIAQSPNQIEAAGAMIDTSQADAPTVRMIQSITSIYDAQWRRDKERIDRIEDENRSHEERITAQDDRILILERTRGVLVDEINKLREGVLNQTIPPLPVISPEIAHLFGTQPPTP